MCCKYYHWLQATHRTAHPRKPIVMPIHNDSPHPFPRTCPRTYCICIRDESQHPSPLPPSLLTCLSIYTLFVPGCCRAAALSTITAPCVCCNPTDRRHNNSSSVIPPRLTHLLASPTSSSHVGRQARQSHGRKGTWHVRVRTVPPLCVPLCWVTVWLGDFISPFKSQWASCNRSQDPKSRVLRAALLSYLVPNSIH